MPLSTILGGGPGFNETGPWAITVTVGGQIQGGPGTDLILRPFAGTILDVAAGDVVGTAGGQNLGTSLLRWGSLFLSTFLGIAGVQADAAAGADQIVIGDGSATDFGMSIYTGPANTGAIYFNDTAGGSQGGFSYDHASDRLNFRTAGAGQLTLTSSNLSPVTTNAIDLGSNGVRFQDLWLAASLSVAGGTVAGAPAAANDVVIGDGSATDFGATIFSGAAATGAYNFARAGTLDAGAVRYDHATDAMFLRTAAGNRITVSAALLGPVTTNAVDLGTAAARYRDGYWDGNLYVDGGTAAGAPANSNIAIGDGVGDHGIGICSADASAGYVMFSRAAAPTTIRSGIAGFHTQNYLAFYANGGVRVLVNNGGILPNTTATYASGTTALRWTDEFLSRGLFIVGVQADGAAGADEIVIGDGTAANFGMSIYTGPAAVGRINFNDTAAGAQGSARYDHSTNLMTLTANSTDLAVISSAALYPAADNTKTLGLSGNRWSTAWATLFRGGGATTETGATNADEIIIGTVATAAIGMTINTTTTGVGTLAFADVDGAALNGGITYEHTGNLLKFYAATVALAQVSSTALAPVTDGVGTLGTSTLGWDQLWFKERATTPAGAATRAVLYVDDSVCNHLWFNPDDDTTRNISRMPSWTFGPGSNSNPAVTAVIDATSLQAYLPLANVVTTETVWEFQIPYTYNLQQLTLTVHYSGDTAASGNVRWARNIRRYVVGELSTVLNSTTTNSTVATSGVQYDQQSTALSTNVSIDSAVAGDWVRIYIARLGGDGADTYTGVIRLHAVTLSETVT